MSQDERELRQVMRDALTQLNLALEAHRAPPTTAALGRPARPAAVILRPEVVEALVCAKPRHAAELAAADIPRFSKNMRTKYSQPILATLQQARVLACAIVWCPCVCAPQRRAVAKHAAAQVQCDCREHSTAQPFRFRA